jgi:hypothetical protein
MMEETAKAIVSAISNWGGYNISHDGHEYTFELHGYLYIIYATTVEQAREEFYKEVLSTD